MITKFEVLHILAEDFPGDGSDGGNVYDAKWHSDSAKHPELRKEVEDEADLFVFEPVAGDWWPADQFFHMVEFTSFEINE